MPEFCTYLVSYRCNARCGMCDSWRMKPGREMTPEEVSKAFGRLGRLAIVRLSGGEPFLRSDFLEVAQAVVDASDPEFLHVTTNGSFPEATTRFAELLRFRGQLRFMVSLDGLGPEHDRNRGADVTFEKALDTVDRLLSLGLPRLHVAVNHTVISERSLEDSAELRTLFRSRGVDVQSVLAYADSSMYAIKLRGKKAEHLIVPEGYPLHPALEGSDVLGFVERELAELDEIRDPLLRIGKRYYLRGLEQRLRKIERPSRPRCVALRSHLRLLPDGRVPVCQFNTETVGSLLHQPIEDLYRSNEARRARRWVDACPGCWAECEVLPSALFTGDVVRGAFG